MATVIPATDPRQHPTRLQRIKTVCKRLLRGSVAGHESIPWSDTLSPLDSDPTVEPSNGCDPAEDVAQVVGEGESHKPASEPTSDREQPETPTGEVTGTKPEDRKEPRKSDLTSTGTPETLGPRPVDAVRDAAACLLQLPDLSVVDVTLATLIANELPGDPLWTVVVSPPSNGKTELLAAASKTPKTYLLSKLTKNTLISGYKTGPGEGEPSLLERLKDTVLILKDFGTILGMHRDERNEILGLLREVYDGKVVKSFGTGKVYSWQGKMGMLAGVTPAFDKLSGVQSILGERFLLYRVPTGDREDRHAQARKALEAAGHEKQLRETLGAAMVRSHQDAHSWYARYSEQITIPPEVDDLLVKLADLAAYGRAGVDRDGYNREVRYLPEAEGPARLVKQLRQLLLALTIIHGKFQPDEEELDILRKVARDTMHPFRARVLAALPSESVTTAEVKRKTGLSYKVVQQELEDCELLGIVKNVSTDGSSSGSWRIVPAHLEMLQESRIFTS